MGTNQDERPGLLTSEVPTAIREESQQWMAHCQCGLEQSLWELGAIRYGGRGNPLKRFYCPRCGEVTWRMIYHPTKAPLPTKWPRGWLMPTPQMPVWKFVVRILTVVFGVLGTAFLSAGFIVSQFFAPLGNIFLIIGGVGLCISLLCWGIGRSPDEGPPDTFSPQ